jgi:hypothetical protein
MLSNSFIFCNSSPSLPFSLPPCRYFDVQQHCDRFNGSIEFSLTGRPRIPLLIWLLLRALEDTKEQHAPNYKKHHAPSYKMDIILQVKKKNPLLQITKGTPVTPCSNFLKGLHAQSYNDDTVLQKLQKEHHAPITNRTPCSKQKYTICKLQKEYYSSSYKKNTIH